MIFSKRKNKKVLYKEYKSQKLISNEVDKEESYSNAISKNHKVKKEKIKKEKKIKEEKYEINNIRNKVVSVTSLKNGVGSSHIAQMIYHYLLQKNMNVCLLTSTDDFYKNYDIYDHLVVDYGCTDIKNSNEYRLSDKKVVVCKLDSEHKKLLESSELSEENFYYFSFVPNEKKGEVFALMEDFKYWCVPICVPESQSKEIKREFARLLFK